MTCRCRPPTRWFSFEGHTCQCTYAHEMGRLFRFGAHDCAACQREEAERKAKRERSWWARAWRWIRSAA